MTNYPERAPYTSQDASAHVERPEETVGRFIQFTRQPFEEGEFTDGDFWITEMYRLYGNEELARVTKDPSFEGVKGIRTTLQLAFETSGLSGLKGEFLVQALQHTRIVDVGGTLISTIIKRIIAFK